MLLEEKFREELKLLIMLFGEDTVKARLPRLNTIHEITEDLWKNQVEVLPGRKVKYLLIAEAPPWSKGGEIIYFYNERCKPRSLMPAVCEAFFGEKIYKRLGIGDTLLKLANQGFLLIDSVPFAMSYSDDKKRSKREYAMLVKSCATSYMLRKIDNSGIRWGDGLKIAFSLRKNAKIIIERFSDGIPFPRLKKKVRIGEDNLATNGANYPCRNKLREIFNLKEERL